MNIIGTTTQEILSRCLVRSSFGNLSELYALTDLPDTVQDFKSCRGQYCMKSYSIGCQPNIK